MFTFVTDLGNPYFIELLKNVEIIEKTKVYGTIYELVIQNNNINKIEELILVKAEILIDLSKISASHNDSQTQINDSQKQILQNKIIKGIKNIYNVFLSKKYNLYYKNTYDEIFAYSKNYLNNKDIYNENELLISFFLDDKPFYIHQSISNKMKNILDSIVGYDFISDLIICEYLLLSNDIHYKNLENIYIVLIDFDKTELAANIKKMVIDGYFAVKYNNDLSIIKQICHLWEIDIIKYDTNNIYLKSSLDTCIDKNIWLQKSIINIKSGDIPVFIISGKWMNDEKHELLQIYHQSLLSYSYTLNFENNVFDIFSNNLKKYISNLLVHNDHSISGFFYSIEHVRKFYNHFIANNKLDNLYFEKFDNEQDAINKRHILTFNSFILPINNYFYLIQNNNDSYNYNFYDFDFYEKYYKNEIYEQYGYYSFKKFKGLFTFNYYEPPFSTIIENSNFNDIIISYIKSLNCFLLLSKNEDIFSFKIKLNNISKNLLQFDSNNFIDYNLFINNIIILFQNGLLFDNWTICLIISEIKDFHDFFLKQLN